MAATDPSTAARLGARLSSHAGVYSAGTGLAAVIGFAYLATLTRFLTTDEFGKLAILLMVASFATLLINIASLQGTFRMVYGAAGGDDDGDDEDMGGEEIAEDDVSADRRRIALTTAVLFTLGLGLLLAATVAVFSASIADALLGDRAERDGVMLAGLSAAAGGVYRLTGNILRMDRRPRAFVAVSVIRPILVLGLAVALLASDGGYEAVLVATTVGSAGAALASVLIARHGFAFGFDPRVIPRIYRLGAAMIPITLSMFVVQQGDVFVLSRSVDDGTIGIYRIASRVAALINFVMAGYFMAWTPLRRTSLFAAATDERGRHLGAWFVLYFVMLGAWWTLTMVVAGDEVLRIFPESYREGATYLPLLGLGLAGNGVMLAVYRGSTFRRKRLKYVSANIIVAIVFVAVSTIVVGPWGARGVAAASAIGFGVGILTLFLFSQTGHKPTPFAYGRMAAAVGLAAAIAGAERIAAGVFPDADVARALVGVVAYPALLLALRIIPGHHARPLMLAIAGWLSLARAPRLTPLDAPVDEDDRRLLDAAVVKGRRVEEVAALTARTAEEVEVDVVAALRRLGGIGEAGPLDRQVGQYLLSRRGTATRDALARALRKDGAAAHDLDRFDELVAALRARGLPAER